MSLPVVSESMVSVSTLAVRMLEVARSFESGMWGLNKGCWEGSFAEVERSRRWMSVQGNAVPVANLVRCHLFDIHEERWGLLFCG